MPPVVAGGAAVFGTLAAGLGPGAAIFAGLSTVALGFVGRALAPKPPDTSDTGSFRQGRTAQIRQPITARRFIYGETRISGPMVFVETSGTDNKYLHLVIALAGHEVEEIGTIWLNDIPITANQLDGSGFVTTGFFVGEDEDGNDKNLVRIKKHTGTDDQTADTDLVSEVGSWTADHRLRGVAYIYVRLEFDRDKFTKIPNISAVVKGKKVLDTRDSTTKWTPNAALCLRDYLTDTSLGLGSTSDEINVLAVNAAANICDEMVSTKAITKSVASVSASRDELSINEDTLELETGDRVTVTSDGALPEGIPDSDSDETSDNIFVIVVNHRGGRDPEITDHPIIQLAGSLDAAYAGNALSITSSGSGNITLTKNAEPRYTANGSSKTDEAPGQVITDMLTAMGGSAFYIGGKWFIKAAAFSSPSITLDEDDLAAGIVVSTKLSRRERFNAVKGVFASPINDWQPSDFPAVTSSTFESEDNGVRIFDELDLPYTTRSQTAQRLAKIHLYRSRQQIQVQYPINLTGLQLQAGDTVQITNTRLGWTQKVFDIVDWSLGVNPDENGAPVLGVDLNLRETASEIYDFDADTEELTFDPAPDTTLPNPFIVQQPTSLGLASGTSVLFLKKDGTVVSRIQATWTDADDQFVHRYEAQVKKSSDSNWQPAGSVETGIERLFVWDVQDGESYDFRIRSINHLGVRSQWVTETGHLVIGKTAPPEGVTGFTVTIKQFRLEFDWNAVSDLDLAGYEIRRGSIWDTATPLLIADADQTSIDVETTTGQKDFLIKAFDTTGNESNNAASASITITASSVSGLSGQFLGSNFTLSWSGTAGSFQIREFEIRRGSTFATATVIANVNTTEFIRMVDWDGSQTWWVQPVDVAGIRGTEQGTTLSVSAASVESVSAQVIDNTVLLSWRSTEGSIPIKTYEIRQGDDFSTADVLGTSDTTFDVITELIGGLKTYWVAPVDTAGVFGAEASLTVTVDAPPDFVFRNRFETDFIGV